MNRPVPCLVGLGALVLAAGCGSVTAKHDGGGTGGAHADSSTKLDLAADLEAEDAHHDVVARADSAGGKDARMPDAHQLDARVSDARVSDASARGGAGGSSGGGTGGAGGSGTGGAGGAGECKSNGDCMLYTGAGSSCCGVCQPKSDPAPPPVECLLACLNPLVTCGCTNQQCVGSTKQL